MLDERQVLLILKPLTHPVVQIAYLSLTLMSAITWRGSLIKILTGVSDLNVMLWSPLLDNHLEFFLFNKASKNLIMDSIKHQIEGTKIKT